MFVSVGGGWSVEGSIYYRRLQLVIEIPLFGFHY